jgi:hypothetical protein
MDERIINPLWSGYCRSSRLRCLRPVCGDRMAVQGRQFTHTNVHGDAAMHKTLFAAIANL